MSVNQAIGREKIGIAFLLLCIFTTINHINLRYFYPWIFDRLPFVVAVLAIITHIIESKSRNNTPFSLNFPVVCILIVYALCFLTSRMAIIDSARSQEYVSNYLKSIILFFLVAFTINSVRELKIYLYTLTLGGVYIVYRTLNYARYEEGRPFATGSTLVSDPNDVAMVIVYSIPLMCALILTLRRKILIPPFLYLFYLMGLGVVYTLSRGGFLASCFMGIAFIKELPKDKKIRYGALTVAVAIFGAFMLPGTFWARISTITNPEEDTTGSASVREENMIIGFEYMIKTPISEYGPGNNGYMLAINKGITDFGEDVFHGNHVHSAYLEIGADIGFIGFFFFMLFHYSLFKALKNAGKTILLLAKTDNNRKLMLIYIKAVKISLVAYMVASTFLPVAYRFYLYFLAGLAVAVERVALNYAKNIKPVAS